MKRRILSILLLLCVFACAVRFNAGAQTPAERISLTLRSDVAGHTEADYTALTGRPVPVYPLTAGVSNKTLTGAIQASLERLPYQEDWMTAEEREKYVLCEEDSAVRRIHAPRDMQEYEASRKRIVFDEFYRFLLEVRELKQKIMTTPSEYIMETEQAMSEYRRLLPFRLTEAQEKAAAENRDCPARREFKALRVKPASRARRETPARKAIRVIRAISAIRSFLSRRRSRPHLQKLRQQKRREK